jgi:phosphoglycerate kinase
LKADDFLKRSMGVFEDPRFAEGTCVPASHGGLEHGAKSIIGGGDSVKAVNQCGLADKVTL